MSICSSLNANTNFRHQERLFGWLWLVAGADLLSEKSTAGWLVADVDLVLRENTAGWLTD